MLLRLCVLYLHFFYAYVYFISFMFIAYSIWLAFQYLLLFTLWSIRLDFNRAPPSVFQKGLYAGHAFSVLGI